MMDCKKALMAEGVDGDISKAIDYLRVKGLAKASSNVGDCSSDVAVVVNCASPVLHRPGLPLRASSDFIPVTLKLPWWK